MGSTRRFDPRLGVEFIVPYAGGPGDLGRGQQMYSAGHGLINIYRGRQDNQDHWFVRRDLDDSWREFLTVEPLEFQPPFRPVGYGTRLDRMFNLGWDPGTESWALFRQELTGNFENERVFAHGAVDVELVDTMGKYQRVVAAAFLDGRPQRAIVDARVAEVYQRISAQLPGVNVEIVDESWDQNRYLVRVRVPNRAGEFLLVDMASESVEPIGPEYDHLADYELAETTLVQIEASTGGTITGHLTLPRDAEGPVPAVMIPRPRPTHEDIADPHYLVQFLAASGYSVFRVQNRVEQEYGRGWLPERAVLGWHQSASDIRDAAGYLVDNGLSEPGAICGAGKDYGAYIALMTAIEFPEVLSCVVSIGGMTDPRESRNPHEMPASDFANVVLLSEARDFMQRASPFRRAGELDAPVLMFNGRLDNDIDVLDQMLVFARVLERADKDVEAIEYPRAMHDISRGPDRIDMLTRVRGFLAEHIGPALAEAESVSAGWRP